MDYNIFAAPYNCPADGNSNCSTAIAAAISAAQASVSTNSTNRILCGQGGTNSVRLVCNSSITYDPLKCVIDLQGAAMFFPNNGTGLIIAPSSTVVFKQAIALQNGLLQGANAFIGTAQSLISVQGPHLTFRDVGVAGTGVGWDLNFANTYLLTWDNCFVTNCSTGIRQNNTPTNSGELLQWIGGGIASCSIGLDFNNSNGGWMIRGTAIDVCNTFLKTAAGPIRVKDCHFETNSANSATGPLFSSAGAFSGIIMEDCEYVWVSGTPPTIVHCDKSTAYSFGVKFIRPYWGGGWSALGATNLSDNTGGLVSVDEATAGTQSATSIQPPLIDLSNTLNSDPNLSSATFQDYWAITKDTSFGRGQLVGTNGSVSLGTTNPHTGLNAIAANKLGGVGSIFAFGLIIPYRANLGASIGAWYRANANSLGTTALNIRFVNANGFALPSGVGGIPFITGNGIFAAGAFSGKTFTANSATLTPTTSYQQSILCTTNSFAPTWTTHVIFEFDMTQMAPGTLFVGAPIEAYKQ